MDGYALKISEAEIGRYQVMAKRAQASEAGLWADAGIRSGAIIADVGCGPAAALALMAQAVGPAGWVSGVDGDESALSRARVLLADAGVQNADVRLGRADATGLEADAFDTVVLRHVLAHNGGSEQRIVNHLATLVRPGGSVYLVDVDLSAMRMHPGSADLADLNAKYVDFHSGRGNDPQVGLRLAELPSGAGLEVMHFRGWFDVTVAPVGMRPPSWVAREAMVASGVCSDADVTRWAAAFDALDQAPERPYCSLRSSLSSLAARGRPSLPGAPVADLYETAESAGDSEQSPVASVLSTDFGRSRQFDETVLGLPVVSGDGFAVVVAAGVVTLRITTVRAARSTKG